MLHFREGHVGVNFSTHQAHPATIAVNILHGLSQGRWVHDCRWNGAYFPQKLVKSACQRLFRGFSGNPDIRGAHAYFKQQQDPNTDGATARPPSVRFGNQF